MTGDQYVKAIKSVGLTISGSGAFFGHSKRQAFRWAAEGPPPAVAKFLQLMFALKLTAAKVDAAIEKQHKR
jgi:hypothetical protein